MKLFNFFKKKKKKPSKKKINKQKTIKNKKEVKNTSKEKKRIIPKLSNSNIQTKIVGLDELLITGIPTGTSILIAGGPGSGKTILTLQLTNNLVKDGKNVLYISLEENTERLVGHMKDFGWEIEGLMQKRLKIIRIDPFSISRNVEALLAKAKGQININVEKIMKIIPKKFKPDIIILDSISALAAAFKDDDENYRIYIEQLFRYFEKHEVNSFFISETESIPKTYSKSGVEEFLADGVIVLYHVKKGNVRNRAIEVLKMRGSEHQNKIVAMKIINKKGLVVYPDQEIIGGIE